MEKNSTLLQASAEQLLFGMKQYCNSISEDLFGWTLEHCLSNNPDATPQDNAYEFLKSHYNQLAGAFRMMTASLTLICSELTEGED